MTLNKENELREDGIKPRHQNRRTLEYYSKKYHLPLPPRVRNDSTGDDAHMSRMFQQININGPETTGMSMKSFRNIAKGKLKNNSFSRIERNIPKGKTDFVCEQKFLSPS